VRAENLRHQAVFGTLKSINQHLPKIIYPYPNNLKEVTYMTIAYRLGNALYLNLTNECPCDCTFCLRNDAVGVNEGQSLWLDHDPTVEEIKDALSQIDFNDYQEIVFCGYGEPTCRLDVLLDIAQYLKEIQDLPIRLNTNGLSDLVNDKKTVPLLAKCIDRISISLNAPNAEMYNALCRPVFGEGSYEAMLQFAMDCKGVIPEVVLSIVPGTDFDNKTIEACRDLCDSMNIPLRVR